MSNLEIERKFVIRKPLELERFARIDIVQTYLISDVGTRRIRMTEKDNVKKYYFTQKLRQTHLTCMEDEREIDENEYNLLLLQADATCKPILKSRYYYHYKGHIFEIDVYPFWQRQCVMEVELRDEGETVCFPPDIEIIKEVTSEPSYKNFALARSVPEEII